MLFNLFFYIVSPFSFIHFLPSLLLLFSLALSSGFSLPFRVIFLGIKAGSGTGTDTGTSTDTGTGTRPVLDGCGWLGWAALLSSAGRFRAIVSSRDRSFAFPFILSRACIWSLSLTFRFRFCGIVCLFASLSLCSLLSFSAVMLLLGLFLSSVVVPGSRLLFGFIRASYLLSFCVSVFIPVVSLLLAQCSLSLFLSDVSWLPCGSVVAFLVARIFPFPSFLLTFRFPSMSAGVAVVAALLLHVLSSSALDSAACGSGLPRLHVSISVFSFCIRSF